MRAALIPVILCSAALLVGAAAASASAAPADPCVLITTSDAATALGATPPKAKSKTAGAVRSCTYTVKKKTMTVQTRKFSSQAAFDKSAKATKGIVFPIQGVGADAWSANGKVLLVWKNGTEITMTFVGVEPFVATQQSLAKTALGRL
ncbi:MAG TPA: hypothetical protein VH063_06165 [Gaiellaceae bacterium]|jgi:hypothetical protein|nr:hypothetical protein [Gaiellaceae bacterium]